MARLERTAAPLDARSRWSSCPGLAGTCSAPPRDGLWMSQAPSSLPSGWPPERGREVVATDIWEQEIADWQRLLARAEPRGTPLPAPEPSSRPTQLRLPYADGSFDRGLTARPCIEHIPGDGEHQSGGGDGARGPPPVADWPLPSPYAVAAPRRVRRARPRQAAQLSQATPDLLLDVTTRRRALKSRLLSGGEWQVRRPRACGARRRRPIPVACTGTTPHSSPKRHTVVGSDALRRHPRPTLAAAGAEPERRRVVTSMTPRARGDPGCPRTCCELLGPAGTPAGPTIRRATG